MFYVARFSSLNKLKQLCKEKYFGEFPNPPKFVIVDPDHKVEDVDVSDLGDYYKYAPVEDWSLFAPMKQLIKKALEQDLRPWEFEREYFDLLHKFWPSTQFVFGTNHYDQVILLVSDRTDNADYFEAFFRFLKIHGYMVQKIEEN